MKRAAGENPLPPSRVRVRDSGVSGTSSALGPQFFAGRAVQERVRDEHPKLLLSLRLLAWASLAGVVLAAFVGLESQSWRHRGDVESQRTSATAKPQIQQNRVEMPFLALKAPVLRANEPKIANNKPLPGKIHEVSVRPRAPQLAVKTGGDAPIALANKYLEGKGVARDCDEAIALLEAAAANSNVRARNRLAGLYATGACVQRDRVQAYRWLRSALASDPQNEWARQNLDLTWRQMTQEERGAFK